MQSVKKKSVYTWPTNLAEFFPMTEYFDIKYRKLESSNIKDRKRKTAHVKFLP